MNIEMKTPKICFNIALHFLNEFLLNMTYLQDQLISISAYFLPAVHFLKILNIIKTGLGTVCIVLQKNIVVTSTGAYILFMIYLSLFI